VHVIEALNGGTLDGPMGGVAFWQKRLNDGFRVTAVGGSDNHNASYEQGHESAVGRPTTVVWAKELSESAVLEGIREGHCFVDVLGSRDREIEFGVSAGGKTVKMGDSLVAPAGTPVKFALTMTGLAGAHAEVVRDGEVKALGGAGQGAKEEREFEEVSDGKRHWVRVTVRGEDGGLLVLGNPVYLNF
jgi:hypothetical protein